MRPDLEDQILINEPLKEKPSFMKRTRNFLKKKWVNAAGGVLLASALTMGAAPKANAQEVTQVAQQEFNYNQTQENASFMGVTAGDHDFSRNLDFVLEDYSLGKNNQPFLLWVHENFDFSNKKVLDEVKKRINNPDQYPMIEAIGNYSPMSPNGRFDGRLDLEAIITRDIGGNEEMFYTDPSDSNFYELDDNYFFDWAFFPGRHMTGFYYPAFGGISPSWDWDMDGIPNRFDMFPFSWDPWDPWMCDPWFNMGRGWLSPWWFDGGWDLGWRHHNYWNYWGGPGLYVNINTIHDHDGNPRRWNDFARTITRDQLKDPNHGPDAIDSVKQLIANRESHRIVLTNDQLQKREQFIKQVDKNNYDALRKNPQIKTRDPDGNERIIKVNPSDYNPENQGRITRTGEPGQPGRGATTITSGRIRDRTEDPNYTGKVERNTERNTNTGKNTERNIERNTEKNPPKPPVMKEPTKSSGEKVVKKEGTKTGEIKKKYDAGYSIDRAIRDYESNASRTTNYAPRTTTTTYPSRLIRPTPSQVNKYSSPTIRNYSPPANQNRTTYRPSTNRTIRSPSSTTRYSQPKYSAPKVTSRSSGSYRAPTRSSGSSYRPSTTRSSSSGTVKKK